MEYLRTFDVIMKVIPEGVDKINSAVASIRFCVPWLKYCKIKFTELLLRSFGDRQGAVKENKIK